MSKSSNKIRFEDIEESNIKIHCSVSVTIEPYGYRQGQRIALVDLNENFPEMTFKQIILAIYKIKSNCVTILGFDMQIFELVNFLKKFINYYKIHINTLGLNVSRPINIKNVLVSYDTFVEGMSNDDSIVLFVTDINELKSAQKEAEDIRREHKYAGRIFIVMQQDITDEMNRFQLDTGLHYKTRYQKMY